MSDAKFMKGVARIALVMAAASGLMAAAAQEPPADIVIRGGTIYPGNAAPFRGDISRKEKLLENQKIGKASEASDQYCRSALRSEQYPFQQPHRSDGTDGVA